MENCKDYESYMFACGNDFNVVIEAENKIKAIEIFQEQFKMRFNEDWKVFRIITKVDIEGNFNRY